MSACPRCGSSEAVVDPHTHWEMRYAAPWVSYATVDCACWPETFQVKHDAHVHEPGEVEVLGAAGEEPLSAAMWAAIAAESHPDERVVGWGVEA